MGLGNASDSIQRNDHPHSEAGAELTYLARTLPWLAARVVTPRTSPLGLTLPYGGTMLRLSPHGSRSPYGLGG